MTNGIFISYRHNDEPHAAVLLQMLLSRRLPHEGIFIDVADIEPGDDFVESLEHELNTCKILLAVIGPAWLDARDASGKRRLDQPRDYVRKEIETALRCGMHIVPVLIKDAPPPPELKLPPSLAPLTRLNAIRPTLEPDGLGVESLARKIERINRPPLRSFFSGSSRQGSAKPLNSYAAPKRAPILDAARQLLVSSKVPPRLTRILLPDVFLLQDPRDAILQYGDVPHLSPSLPYVEILNWCNEIMEGKQPNIEVKLKPGRFELSGWVGGDGDAIRAAAFDAFRAAKPKTFDGPVVRVDGYRIAGPKLLITAQQATYFEQVRSHLVLDYQHRLPNGSVLSLRDLLRQEFGKTLPSLNDGRLANSLGVAALIFCRWGDDFTPYLIARTRDVAVNDAGNEWHCTASGVAELREAMDGAQTFVEWSIRKELEEEVGLTREDLDTLAPVAFCRELMRAGKPQVFFLGITSLSASELKRKLKGARRRAKQVGDIIENSAMPLLRKPTKLTLTEATALFHGKTIAAEAAACLHYFFKCVGAGDQLS